MKIIIAGATGLIGKALCDRLLRDGHRLTALVRRPDQARRLLPGTSVVQWDAFTAALGAEFLEGADAVVNLSGEPIASGHWKEAKKKRIRESRILGTRGLLETISRCEKAPKVLVNGSAIGFYGDRSEEILDEESMSGRGFLADVVVQWEAEAQKLKEQDIRVVLIRTGLVLSARGGALSRMLLPFRMFVGGPLGDGRQWMSWIHIQDEVEIIRQALSDGRIEGPGEFDGASTGHQSGVFYSTWPSAEAALFSAGSSLRVAVVAGGNGSGLVAGRAACCAAQVAEPGVYISISLSAACFGGFA